jgi:hypothetical protein
VTLPRVKLVFSRKAAKAQRKRKENYGLRSLPTSYIPLRLRASARKFLRDLSQRRGVAEREWSSCFLSSFLLCASFAP